MKNKILPAALSVCLLFASCKAHNTVKIDEAFVEGGTMIIGNGTYFKEYEYNTADLYASRYEYSWGLLAQVINYGIEHKDLEIKNNKLYPLSGSFPDFSKVILDFSKLSQFINSDTAELSAAAGYEDYPVHSIAWFGIPYILNIMSRMNNYTPCYETVTWKTIEGADGYRLPTFEEWEFLARGGMQSAGYIYSGSNDDGEIGWFTSNSEGTVHKGGLKKPNELGLYDMSGNVNEFTTEIGKPVMIAPEVTLLTANSLWRGGSYNSSPVSTFEFRQNINFPDYFLPFADVGFRTVRTAKISISGR